MAYNGTIFRPTSQATTLPYSQTQRLESTYITAANCSHNCSNSTLYETFDCWGHSDTPDIQLILILYLVFIIIGVLGNTLSVLVFSSKDMRNVSSHTYLLILACSDMGYLMSVFFVKGLPGFRCSFHFKSIFDPHNRSAFGCIFFQFAMDLFSDFSSCLILAFTVERFLAVYKPAYYRQVCTTYRAKMTSFILFNVITALILPYHVLFMEIMPSENICVISNDHQQLFSTLYFTEATTFRILPVVLIAVFNAMIVYHFRRTSMRTSLRHTTAERMAKRNEARKRLTKILFLVSSTYIVSYLPSLIHFLLWKMYRHEVILLDDVRMTKSREYVNLLYIMQFAINFFLYTVSGPLFRQSLIKLLGCESCCGCCFSRGVCCCRTVSRQHSLVQTDQSVKDELKSTKSVETGEEASLRSKECNGCQYQEIASEM